MTLSEDDLLDVSTPRSARLPFGKIAIGITCTILGCIFLFAIPRGAPPSAVVDNSKRINPVPRRPLLESTNPVSSTTDLDSAAKVEPVFRPVIDRLTLPEPIEDDIHFEWSDEKSAGRLYMLPETQAISQSLLDEASGDLLLIVHGKASDGMDGNWLTVVPSKKLSETRAFVQPSRFFPELNRMHACFKRFQGRKYVIILRNNIVWILDAMTLTAPDDSCSLLRQIDLDQSKYKRVMQRMVTPGSVDQIQCGFDDDSFVTITGYEGQLKLDLLSGELATLFTESNSSAWRDAWDVTEVRKHLTVEGGVPEDTKVADAVDSQGNVTKKVLKRRPFTVARGKTSLAFRGTYDPSITSEIKVPSPLIVRPEASINTLTNGAFDDVANDRLILAEQSFDRPKRSAIWVLPLDQAGIPDLPMMAVRIFVPHLLTVNQSQTIEIEKIDPRFNLNLVRRPVGAQLVNGKILWTPTIADIGEHEFELQLQSSGITVPRKFRAAVGFPMADISFSPSRMRMSMDEKIAVAWTKSQIALWDVENQKELATRTTHATILDAAITSDHVFILYYGDNALEKCRLEDLAPESIYFLTEPIDRLAAVNDTYLLLQETRRRNASWPNKRFVFELPRLEQNHFTKMIEDSSWHDLNVRTLNGDVVFGPMVLDRKTKSVKSLFRLEGTNILHLGNRPMAASGERNLQSASLDSVEVGDWKLSPRTNEVRRPGKQVSRVKVSTEIRNYKNQEVRTQPIGEFDGTSSGAAAVSAGNTLAIHAGRKVFTLKLSDIGLPSEAMDAATPSLAIRALSKLTVVSRNDETAIRFVVSGGTPPYELTANLDPSLFRIGPFTQKVEADVIHVDSIKNSVSIDGSLLNNAIHSSKESLVDCLKHFASTRPQSMNPLQYVDQYVRETNSVIKSFTTRQVKDFPMLTSFTLNAKDSDGTQVSLTHEFLITIDRNEVVDFLTKLDAKNNDNFRSSTVARQPGDVPRPNVPIFWDPTPIELSNVLRTLRYNDPQPEDLSTETLAYQLAIADNLSFARDREGMEYPAVKNAKQTVAPEREWEIRDLREPALIKRVKGAIVGGDVRGVALRITHTRGDEIWFEIDLIDARRFVEHQLPIVLSDCNSLPRTISFRQNESSWMSFALYSFRDNFGCLPTQSIVSSSGERLLSWRVAILPYLGYQKLYELFHLDEPWDSPHNIKLVPHMPFIFAPRDQGAELGQATVLALTGPNTAFPLDSIRRIRDLNSPIDSILMFVEVKREHAVPWTKPEDIIDSPDQSWRTMLNSSNQVDQKIPWATGWYADGRVRNLAEPNDPEGSVP